MTEPSARTDEDHRREKGAATVWAGYPAPEVIRRAQSATKQAYFGVQTKRCSSHQESSLSLSSALRQEGSGGRNVLIILMLMAIFGWGWTIFGLPIGWVGIVGVLAYIVMWNVSRWQVRQESTELLVRMGGAFQKERSTRAPRGHGLISGLDTPIGRWEGMAEAQDEGVLVTGEHIWWESWPGGEKREPAKTMIRWDQLERASWQQGRLQLKPNIPILFSVVVSDFNDSGPEPWLEILEKNGIPLEQGDA